MHLVCMIAECQSINLDLTGQTDVSEFNYEMENPLPQARKCAHYISTTDTGKVREMGKRKVF